MIISIRLKPDDEHKLKWLLKDVNREPKAYADQTISDIIRIAINNEYSSKNLQHHRFHEEKKCDEQWLKNYS